MNTLIFIIARAKSQRLPGKHTAVIGGKPLIAHVIEHCLATGYPTVVSSNDDGVLEVAAQYPDLEFTLRRPEGLCNEDIWDDAAKMHEAIREYHLDEWSNRFRRERELIYVNQYGDTMFFNDTVVSRAIQLVKDTGAINLDTAYKVDTEHPANMMEVDANGIATRHREAGGESGLDSRRFRPLYMLDGGVAIHRYPEWYGDRRLLVNKKYDVLAIHTQEDVDLANYLWNVRSERRVEGGIRVAG
jgi:hypothetical protein